MAKAIPKYYVNGSLQETIEYVESQWRSGVGTAQIASDLLASQSTIRKFIYEHTSLSLIEAPKWFVGGDKAKTIRYIKKAIKSQYKREVALDLGCSIENLTSFMHKNGIKMPSKNPEWFIDDCKENTYEFIMARIGEGVTENCIAKELGATKDKVYHFLKRRKAMEERERYESLLRQENKIFSMCVIGSTARSLEAFGC